MDPYTRFLKQQVALAVHARNSVNPPPDAHQRVYYAKSALQMYKETTCNHFISTVASDAQ